jgi:hypothetical protein
MSSLAPKINKTCFVFFVLFGFMNYRESSFAQNEDQRTEAPEPAVADRVVVAINNIPYTQLQIESYLNVKESLRDNADSSQVVNGTNWSMAIDAFTNDMMIHQEATKSSGFRPTKESIQKLRARSEKITSSVPQFKAAFERLMLSSNEIESEILRIATVENYRKGKASLSTNGKNAQAGWEKELQSRSIVRLFDGAKTWKVIQPRL